MKLIITLFTLCIFSSSCSSYKNLDFTKLEIDGAKNYKIIDLNGSTTKTNKCQKVKDTLSYDRLIVPVSKIKEIRQRKFSFLKTEALVIGIIGLEILIIYKSTSKIGANIGLIESPN
jgi:hypothetical protein